MARIRSAFFLLVRRRPVGIEGVSSSNLEAFARASSDSRHAWKTQAAMSFRVKLGKGPLSCPLVATKRFQAASLQAACSRPKSHKIWCGAS